MVFYSKGSGFYKYFERLIAYITSHSDITVHYVTNDFHDQIFQNTNPQIEKYYIGPIAIIQFMMLIDADMVVMTTPDLEQYHIKRSLVRKDIEYIYLDHGMTSFHLMLKKGALDHYDTIFCYGPNHIQEIRETEKIYNLPAKNLVKTGYPLLSTLLVNYEESNTMKNDPKIILIAPSWQRDIILDYCLEETLRPLLNLNYKIIVRPHPEFIKRFPRKMRTIIETYEHEFGDNFLIETDFSSNKTVYTADLVITDWSSIAQEFSYTTKKPSLFINTPMKIMNPEYEKIPLVPLDISLRDEIGISVDVDKLNTISSVVETLFAKQDWYRHHITEVLSQNIYDVNNGAQGSGDYIISTLTKRQEQRQEGDNPDFAKQECDISLKEQFEEIAYLTQTVFGDIQNNKDEIMQILSQDIENFSIDARTNGEYLLYLLQMMAFLKRQGGEKTDD